MEETVPYHLSLDSFLILTLTGGLEDCRVLYQPEELIKPVIQDDSMTSDF